MDHLQKAQSNGVVLGLKAVAGVVRRLDIDELLLQEPDAFNLFVLAFSELKSDNKIMGYFQIAGIHGLPKETWNGIKFPTGISKSPKQTTGYCAHGLTTFPTWHRPYLAMIEQTVYLKMLEIARKFKDPLKQQYLGAVQRFRLPYWDYFRPRAKKDVSFRGIMWPKSRQSLSRDETSFPYDFSIPQIFTVSKVMVRKPDQTELTEFDNPFVSFDFSSGRFKKEDWELIAGQTLSSSWSQKRTLRHPYQMVYVKDKTIVDPSKETTGKDPNISPSALTQNSVALDKQRALIELNMILNKQREPLTAYCLNMMKNYANIPGVATNATTPFADNSGSLEGIHGSYHLIIGGPGGHMSQVPIAAFDPVFWFHHVQIDRWFAVWQAIHPDQWFEKSDRGLETSDLLPFRADDTTFWTSAGSNTSEYPYSTRYCDDFGYTYADIQDKKKDQALPDFLKKYQWSLRRSNDKKVDDPPSDAMKLLDVSQAQVFKYRKQEDQDEFLNALLSSRQNPDAEIPARAALMPEAQPSGRQFATLESAPEAPGLIEMDRDAGVGGIQTNLALGSGPLAAEEPKEYTEWFVDHVVERLALNGSFTVYYFLGPFENEASQYMAQPTLAGLSHNFTAPVELCDNCGRQDQQALLVADTAPITPMLQDYVKLGQLQSLTPEHVRLFLVKNLKWRITTVDGERVDPRTVRGFKLSISSVVTPLPSGPPTIQDYPEITQEIISNSS